MKIVGFTVIDATGHEDELLQFIKTNVLLESPDYSQNIVDAGSGITVYGKDLTAPLFTGVGFTYSLVTVSEDEIVVASAVDFPVEVPIDGVILRLLPTEFEKIAVTDSHKREIFDHYFKNKLLVPLYGTEGSGSSWILETGYWNMEGFWFDDKLWNY